MYMSQTSAAVSLGFQSFSNENKMGSKTATLCCSLQSAVLDTACPVCQEACSGYGLPLTSAIGILISIGLLLMVFKFFCLGQKETHIIVQAEGQLARK